MMLRDEEMSNYVDRKRWIREWVKRREEKGAYYTIFEELAVEDTPRSFLNNFLVSRDRHLERLLLSQLAVRHIKQNSFSIFVSVFFLYKEL